MRPHLSVIQLAFIAVLMSRPGLAEALEFEIEPIEAEGEMAIAGFPPEGVALFRSFGAEARSASGDDATIGVVSGMTMVRAVDGNGSVTAASGIWEGAPTVAVERDGVLTRPALPPGMTDIADVHVDEAGNVWFVDSVTCRVYSISLAGEIDARFSSSHYTDCRGLATRELEPSVDRVWLTVSRSSELIGIDVPRDGSGPVAEPTIGLGGLGTGVRNLTFPRDVEVLPDGTVVVADTGNSRIGFMPDGANFFVFVGTAHDVGPVAQLGTVDDGFSLVAFSAQRRHLVTIRDPFDSVTTNPSFLIRDFDGDEGGPLLGGGDYFPSSPDILIRRSADIANLDQFDASTSADLSLTLPNLVYVAVRNLGSETGPRTALSVRWDIAGSEQTMGRWRFDGVEAPDGGHAGSAHIGAMDTAERVLVGPFLLDISDARIDRRDLRNGVDILAAVRSPEFRPRSYQTGNVSPVQPVDPLRASEIAMRRTMVIGADATDLQQTLVVDAYLSDEPREIDTELRPTTCALAADWLARVSFGQATLECRTLTYELAGPAEDYARPGGAASIVREVICGLDGDGRPVDRLLIEVDSNPIMGPFTMTFPGSVPLDLGSFTRRPDPGGEGDVGGLGSVECPASAFIHGTPTVSVYNDILEAGAAMYALGSQFGMNPTDAPDCDSVVCTGPEHFDVMNGPAFIPGEALVWHKEQVGWVVNSDLATPSNVEIDVDETMQVTLLYPEVDATAHPGAYRAFVAPSLFGSPDVPSTRELWLSARRPSLEVGDPYVAFSPARGVLAFETDRSRSRQPVGVIPRPGGEPARQALIEVGGSRDLVGGWRIDDVEPYHSEAGVEYGLTIRLSSNRLTWADLRVSPEGPEDLRPDIGLHPATSGYPPLHDIVHGEDDAKHAPYRPGLEHIVTFQVENAGNSPAPPESLARVYQYPADVVTGFVPTPENEICTIDVSGLDAGESRPLTCRFQPKRAEAPTIEVVLEIKEDLDFAPSNDVARRRFASVEFGPNEELALTASNLGAVPAPVVVGISETPGWHWWGRGVSTVLAPGETTDISLGISTSTDICSEAQAELEVWEELHATYVLTGRVEALLRNRAKTRTKIGNLKVLPCSAVSRFDLAPTWLSAETTCQAATVSACTQDTKAEELVFDFMDEIGLLTQVIAATDRDGCAEVTVPLTRGGHWTIRAANEGNECSMPSGHSLSIEVEGLWLEDQDGDQVLDVDELAGDDDADGVPNHLDVDSDNDGVPDGDDQADRDCDGDGVVDRIDPDPCFDDPALGDTDGDGLSDIEELLIGTSPFLIDTDGDGQSDADEYFFGMNPLDPSDGFYGQDCGSLEDTDGDGAVGCRDLECSGSELCKDGPSARLEGCFVHSDCSGISSICVSEAISGLPGGMCTAGCYDSTECASDSTCLYFDGGGMCVPTCESDVDCPGSCLDLGVLGVCGAACVDDGACLERGFCDTSSGVCTWGKEDCYSGFDDDMDGLADCADPDCAAESLCLTMDSDGDGVPDVTETLAGTDSLNPDTDGDGLCDGPNMVLPVCYPGEDLNVSGARDDDEPHGLVYDSDHSDRDDFSEWLVFGTDPNDGGDDTAAMYDADGDGLSNKGEARLGTDPMNPDTDGGGTTDGEEVLRWRTNPFDGLDDLRDEDCSSGKDEDRDGLIDCDDPDCSGPCSAPEPPTACCDESGCLPACGDEDAEGDGLPLWAEFEWGSDPSWTDSDGDGLCDGPFSADGCIAGEDRDADGALGPDETSPVDWDTDGGGVDDFSEWLIDGTDPQLAADDGLATADSDGDGLADLGELRLGTDPGNSDTDGGGVSDGRELGMRTNPLDASDDVVAVEVCDNLHDDDGDGLPDCSDPDCICAPGPSGIGGKCKSASDCSTPDGLHQVCIPEDVVGVPSGMCSEWCWAEEDCATEWSCMPIASTYGICAPVCDSDADCSSGACLDVGPFSLCGSPCLGDGDCPVTGSCDVASGLCVAAVP